MMTKEPRELDLDDLELVSGSGDDFSLASALELTTKMLELQSSQTIAVSQAPKQAVSKSTRH